MQRITRPRLDAVLVQAVIAAALSFAHLHDIAHAAGQDGWKAWAYPISVDLLLVAAWRRLRAGETTGLAWFWFVIALTASLGANVATAGFLDLDNPPAWLRILVAGWPAAAFLGGTLLAHAPGPQATATTDGEPAPVPRQEPRAEPTAEPMPVAESRPELPGPAEAAAPVVEPSPTDRPEVPAALIAHARKVADNHRAATGRPIDVSTLRTRLGVPAPMADAIAAQLA